MKRRSLVALIPVEGKTPEQVGKEVLEQFQRKNLPNQADLAGLEVIRDGQGRLLRPSVARFASAFLKAAREISKRENKRDNR